MISFKQTPLFVLVIAFVMLCGVHYVQYKHTKSLERRLASAETTIMIIQEQQAINEKILSKYPTLVQAKEKENAQRKERLNQVIQQNSSWADSPLPFDVNGVLRKDRDCPSANTVSATRNPS